MTLDAQDQLNPWYNFWHVKDGKNSRLQDFGKKYFISLWRIESAERPLYSLPLTRCSRYTFITELQLEGLSLVSFSTWSAVVNITQQTLLQHNNNALRAPLLLFFLPLATRRACSCSRLECGTCPRCIWGQLEERVLWSEDTFSSKSSNFKKIVIDSVKNIELSCHTYNNKYYSKSIHYSYLGFFTSLLTTQFILPINLCQIENIVSAAVMRFYEPVDVDFCLIVFGYVLRLG